MGEESELLNITKCPICGQAHQYQLEVKRSLLMQFFTTDAMKQRRRSFVRLFVCPEKGEKFKATIHLTETSSDPIESVEVVEG
jgi:hypothetical protein